MSHGSSFLVPGPI